MVNPGAFRNSRRDFLMSKKVEYSAAVIGNYVADAVAKIQRQYLKRYPIDLPHDKEPSQAFLKAIDDDAPDAEPEEPNPETMSESEYRAAVEKAKARKSLLDYRKKQIKRWLAYQYIKDNDVRSKETGAYMPYTSLMKKLTGKDCVRPRLKTPTNVWRKTQHDLIEEHLKVEIELEHRLGKTIPSTQYASIRDKIARQLFAELDEGTRQEWREKAAAEHKLALQKYREEINNDPSMEPADIQMAIQGMVQFMQPILDMVAAVTGWKVSLLAGGPEPVQSGRLSVISIHSGYTSGDVKMTYGRAERARYKKHVIPSFGAFLKLCYTPEECRTRALAEEDGYMPMSAYENNTDETTYHSIEPDTPSNDKAEASASTQPHTKAPAASPTPTSPEVRIDQSSAPVVSTVSASTPHTKVPAASPTPTSPEVRIDQSSAPITSTSSTSTSSAQVSNDRAPVPVKPTTALTPAASEDCNEQAMASSDSTDSSTTPSKDCNDYTTQDRMPSDANPFPFEDLNGDEDEFEDIRSLVASPVPSVPPSPACSRSASPPPIQPASHHLENTTMTDAVAQPAPIAAPPLTNVISKASGAVPKAMPLSSSNRPSMPKGVLNGRKRKNLPDAAVASVSATEPPTKRVRTKTLRAMESEEQSTNRRKRNSGKKVAEAGNGGKENSTAVSVPKASGRGKRV